MAKLDHVAIPVGDLAISRDWYVAMFGLEVEFETATIVSLKDENALSLFLGQATSAPATTGFGFWFQLDDVDAFHRVKSAAGISFVHPPQKTLWGYGAELRDPDGFAIYIWDEKSMAAHS